MCVCADCLNTQKMSFAYGREDLETTQDRGSAGRAVVQERPVHVRLVVDLEIPLRYLGEAVPLDQRLGEGVDCACLGVDDDGGEPEAGVAPARAGNDFSQVLASSTVSRSRARGAPFRLVNVAAVRSRQVILAPLSTVIRVALAPREDGGPGREILAIDGGQVPLSAARRRRRRRARRRGWTRRRWCGI